jgi:hypothetical protein
MASGKEEFERQLREMGIEPHAGQGDNRVVFDYVVSEGRFTGTQIRIGLIVPPEFSRTPPGGPHVSPRLLPMNPSASDHSTKTAESEFGPEWQYLSRPYRGAWTGRKGVADYLAHIDHLFATI